MRAGAIAGAILVALVAAGCATPQSPAPRGAERETLPEAYKHPPK